MPIIDRASTPQRLGFFLSGLEALLFLFVAAMHAGFEARLGGMTFGAQFLYPAAIVEVILALALLLALVLPGQGSTRVGRLIAAQMLAVIGVLVGQVALMRGASLTTWRNEVFYAVAFVLSLGSLALLATPTVRRQRRARG
jgi:hypothetical protein